MKRLYEFDSYQVDFERRLLQRGEQFVQLPSKALDTLFVLIQHRGEVVSKDDLMKAVWPDAFVEEGNLSQSIHVLRKALGESVGEHRYIVTIPGRGYRFVANVRERSEMADGDIPNALVEPSTVSNSAPSPNKHIWFEQVPSGLPGFLKPHKIWMMSLLITVLVLALVLFTLRPSIARFFNNRGVQLQRRGQLRAAIGDYQQALGLNPDYAEAHYNLADAYEEITDYDKALQEYRKAIDADFMFYQAYNNLSRLYILRRRDYGAAMRLLDRAMSLKPLEPSVQYSLYKNYGWANFELNQLGQAEQHLKSAVAMDPERGAAHCLLAKVLDAQGKATGAAEWESCAAYSSQLEVEPEWRNEAQERLRKELLK